MVRDSPHFGIGLSVLGISGLELSGLEMSGLEMSGLEMSGLEMPGPKCQGRVVTVRLSKRPTTGALVAFEDR